MYNDVLFLVQIAKKKRIPKKDDLLSWLKENDRAHQEVQERHHKENIGVMKELIDVLRQRGTEH